VYDLLPSNVVGVTYAYLMTKVEHNGKRLLYGGPLDRFGLLQDGRFSYFVLRRAERTCIEVANPRERTPEKRAIIDGPIDEREVDFLHISGEEVANAYFVRYALPSAKNAGEAIKTIEAHEVQRRKDLAAESDSAPQHPHPPSGET
jgi:hypothetical protein